MSVAGWIAESLQTRPLAGADLRSHRAVTREQVAVVHDETFVKVVEAGRPRKLAE